MFIPLCSSVSAHPLPYELRAQRSISLSPKPQPQPPLRYVPAQWSTGNPMSSISVTSGSPASAARPSEFSAPSSPASSPTYPTYSSSLPTSSDASRSSPASSPATSPGFSTSSSPRPSSTSSAIPPSWKGTTCCSCSPSPPSTATRAPAGRGPWPSHASLDASIATSASGTAPPSCWLSPPSELTPPSSGPPGGRSACSMLRARSSCRCDCWAGPRASPGRCTSPCCKASLVVMLIKLSFYWPIKLFFGIIKLDNSATVLFGLLVVELCLRCMRLLVLDMCFYGWIYLVW
ncbi:hypothetical protein VPH35_001075 [Triticum aestivum]|uniref:Uncharacterized protein n=1 Tax=Triticum turgidum subsp. durum TaxID=4567 RepID=A0A9R0PYK5_TRITD|nr:unnamed protein product [Triticum turgidum subsp. durum]